jgi:hypothetical protein
MFSPELVSFGYKVAASAAIGVIMTIVLWPFRKARAEWKSLKDEQSSIHAELVQQRTNCLATLQTQGDRQIELLGKVADTLTGMALSQAEQTGFLRASALPTRRRVAKK